MSDGTVTEAEVLTLCDDLDHAVELVTPLLGPADSDIETGYLVETAKAASALTRRLWEERERTRGPQKIETSDRNRLGSRGRDQLAKYFGRMYAGWDRGVNLDQPESGKFVEAPMSAMELEARYVAAEIGLNIFEIANAAAFAPITVYNTIQKFLGPVFAAAEAQRDSALAQLEEARKEIPDSVFIGDDKVEEIARAINGATGPERELIGLAMDDDRRRVFTASWDEKPEFLKEIARKEARAVLALFTPKREG